MAAPAPQQGQRLQKVMVAVDESECSRHALEWVLRNLAPTLAPPLLVLTVQPPSPLGYVSAASFGAPLGTVPPVAPELMKSMQEQQRELTRALLDKAMAICADHGIERWTEPPCCEGSRHLDPPSQIRAHSWIQDEEGITSTKSCCRWEGVLENHAAAGRGSPRGAAPSPVGEGLTGRVASVTYASVAASASASPYSRIVSSATSYARVVVAAPSAATRAAASDWVSVWRTGAAGS